MTMMTSTKAPLRHAPSLVVGLVLGLVAVAATMPGCARHRRNARDQIIFGHGSHAKAGLGCPSCHQAALAEGTQDADLLPAKSTCTDCHTAPEEQECSYCHTNPTKAGPYQRDPRRIHFEHVAHENPAKGECVRCHASDVDTTSLANFEPHAPDHDDCSSCHQADFRTLECAGCHVDLSDYELVDLVEYQHPLGFVQRHGNAAKSDAAVCTQCHEPTFCNDCHIAAPRAVPLELVEHTQVWRDFVHRGDFLTRHAVEAQLERNQCALCHGVSFCDGCHRESGIGGSVAPGSPHPPGWLDPTSPNGHARAARRDLLSCASCHESDAEATCAPCHQVGGVAGNPHPPGFGMGLNPREHALCRACHVP